MTTHGLPIDGLWQKLARHLNEGNFSALENDLGGPEGFDRRIITWFDMGKFSDEPELLAEALSCACMLGRTETARFLVENGVDPYAGMKTWLSGPHYAVSGGHLDTVLMLLENGISLEVKNGYGGTLLGQALWSAVNEHKRGHADIIEVLIDAGAVIEHGSLEWWTQQPVPSEETKSRVTNALRRRTVL